MTLKSLIWALVLLALIMYAGSSEANGRSSREFCKGRNGGIASSEVFAIILAQAAIERLVLIKVQVVAFEFAGRKLREIENAC